MVLLVKDSLTAGEAVRLMCITSGARLRRADCMETARRHLRIYRPDVAIVDMGLPDGDGAELISELAQATPRTQTIIGLSADPSRATAAMKAGADSFIEKPLNSIAGFQSAILMNLPNHRRPEIMFKAFEIAGYGKEEVEKRFGGMVNAFQYGAPPHGGCAAGIDRIVMLLADEANIREVIMFPMNQRAEDLMMAAPSEPMNEQLRELSLRVIAPE
ncbi:response regulator [Planktomarina temperata]|nr:response regulator [Planktomarina temperata]